METPIAPDSSNSDVTPVPRPPEKQPLPTSPSKAKKDELDIAVDRIIAANAEAPSTTKRGRRLKPMRPPPSITVDPVRAVNTAAQEENERENKPAAMFQMGTPTSRDLHFIGTPSGKKGLAADEEVEVTTQERSEDASVTLNEQEWPSDLVIQSQADKGPVIRDLLQSTSLSEEAANQKSACEVDTGELKTSNGVEDVTNSEVHSKDSRVASETDVPEHVEKAAEPEVNSSSSETSMAHEKAERSDPDVQPEHSTVTSAPEAAPTASAEAIASKKDPPAPVKSIASMVDQTGSVLTAEQDKDSASYSKTATTPACSEKCAEQQDTKATPRPPPSPEKVVSVIGPKPSADKRMAMHIRKCKVVEDGLHLACSLEDQGSLKEAEAQFRRTLGICSTLLGERPPTAHKSMRELRSRATAALERLRGS